MAQVVEKKCHDSDTVIRHALKVLTKSVTLLCMDLKLDGIHSEAWRKSHWMQRASQWIFMRLRNLFWGGSAFSLVLAISFDLTQSGFWVQDVKSICLCADWRQRLEVSVSERAGALTKHFPKDSTTLCYNIELPWQPDWVGPFGKWQLMIRSTIGKFHSWVFFLISCFVVRTNGKQTGHSSSFSIVRLEKIVGTQFALRVNRFSPLKWIKQQ